MQDKVDHDTMIKVSVFPRYIGAALTMARLSRRVTSEWRGCPHTAGVSLELRQFASPNERCRSRVLRANSKGMRFLQ